MVRASILGLLLLISTITSANLPEVKDPFALPMSTTCNELEQQLFSQFDHWQYQGFVEYAEDSQANPLSAWVTNQKEWIVVDVLTQSLVFSPWQVIAITKLKIEWQTILPVYCGKTITFIMTFMGF